MSETHNEVQETYASGSAPTGSRRLPAFLPTPPPVGDDGPSPDALAQMSATNVTSYLIAGPVTFGGLGWLVDKWLKTSFAVPVGIVLGLALALYIVWFRYGRSSTAAQPGSTSPETTADRRATGADDEEKR